ncbi:thiamine biosynthesis lipoprotein [Mariprofundus aestuarium]|uniref:FAD:protein FMN transferase n=1 Tax=Mariprofundus aestuarium TaxID=1921086 RepID=A0A2K8L1I5_MARES|nr:FAD:protein FMN transferase [Mariprofundus aestuarium]ATX79681.1 thiamine biosynthesis lipoprotein [Mariprofundus aestuarium]
MLRLFTSMIVIALAACSAPSDIRDSRFIMGTLVEFTVVGVDDEVANTAISTAANEMQRIEDLFTVYGEHDNSVKQFNRAPVGTPVRLPDEVSRLLEAAETIKIDSHGAFDPSLGGLNLLWGFSLHDKPTAPPPQKKIEQATPPAFCVEKQGDAWMRLNKRCQLDFGAIAKGYAIDRGIEILKSHGIEHAIINAGGDLRLIGRHGDRPWRIGIRHPRLAGEVIESLELEGDVAVVTSGDYERYYLFEGRRYHHILDPKTGWPAAGSQSATVVADSAMLADAWSTALFILGNQPFPTPNNLNMRLLIVDNKGDITANTL